MVEKAGVDTISATRRQVEKEPDPTLATTEQILREFGHLREFLTAELRGNIASVEARLEAMDKAITLLEAFPTAVDTAVGNLQALHDEKFGGVEKQFMERDTRVAQTNEDRQKAIDAAFSAAAKDSAKEAANVKEIITKMEAFFNKQIDGLNESVSLTKDGLTDKITGLKDLITASDGRTKGIGDSWQVIAVVGTLALAALAIFYKQH